MTIHPTIRPEIKKENERHKLLQNIVPFIPILGVPLVFIFNGNMYTHKRFWLSALVQGISIDLVVLLSNLI